MTRREISTPARRATTKTAQRRARRADRPTNWGFPHWWEHGQFRSFRWLIARGKNDSDFITVIDPGKPIGNRAVIIARYDGRVVGTF